MFVASGGGGESSSGGGMVKIYDVGSGRLERTLRVDDSHGHAVNGVSYFPCPGHFAGEKFSGLLAVAVGSRQFDDVPSDDDDDDDDDTTIAGMAIKERPGSLRLYGI